MKKKPNIAVVGATGAVGVEILRLLAERGVSASRVKAFGSAGKGRRTADYGATGIKIPVIALTHDKKSPFAGIEYAIFSAGGGVSKEWAPIAVEAGCTVIDNSSTFRMRHDVPLVIPEINPGDLSHHKGIIANPNCATAIALMALYPLHRRFRAMRVIASSYQSVSGAGARGLKELRDQNEALVHGKPVTREVFSHQIAGNVIPHIGDLIPDGRTTEEVKFQNEGRKILGHRSLIAEMTCVRVPIERCHSVSITAEFESLVNADEAGDILMSAPGVGIIQHEELPLHPTPVEVSGQERCFVGRIRTSTVFGAHGLSLWVVGDQLLKGAALNAVQILDLLTKQ